MNPRAIPGVIMAWTMRQNGRMIRLLSIGAMVIAVCAAQAQDVKVTVNVDDKATISGQTKFKVSVQAKNAVNQVEFYVGDDLRSTDDSTPYEFTLDTIAEKEGALKLKFAAFTSEGDRGEKVLDLTIDNQLDKGADFHVDRAKELVANSKWDEAIAAGRVALKAKEKYLPAEIVMARANLGKGVFDTAQKFIDDALAQEPNNPEVLQLASAIRLKAAFMTLNRGGDKNETAKAIKQALLAAVQARSTYLGNLLDKIGAVTDTNRMSYVDTAILAHRYSRAIDALATIWKKDFKNTAVANRLLYAQLRSSRLSDAAQTIADYEKFGSVDAYGNALRAIFYNRVGKIDQSNDAEREAILGDSQDLGVRTTQAFLALIRQNKTALGQISTDLAKDEGNRPIVNYYLSTILFVNGYFEESQNAFQKAAMGDPANYDMFIEAGNQAIILANQPSAKSDDKKLQMAAARSYFEVALAVRPDSFEALTGLSILDLMDGKTEDAVRRARAATAASKEYAAGHYALSAALGTLGNSQEGIKCADIAGKLDDANLGGRGIPTVMQVWQYFYRYGRMPLITPPK